MRAVVHHRFGEPSEVLGVEVPRVERQQEDGEDAGDQAAEPVDQGVPAQAGQLCAEAHRSRA